LLNFNFISIKPKGLLFWFVSVFFCALYCSLIIFNLSGEPKFTEILSVVSNFMGAIFGLIATFVAWVGLATWQRQVKAPVRYKSLFEAFREVNSLRNLFHQKRFKRSNWEHDLGKTEASGDTSQQALDLIKVLQEEENKITELKVQKPDIEKYCELLIEQSRCIDHQFSISHVRYVSGDCNELMLEIYARSIENSILTCIEKLTKPAGECNACDYQDSLQTVNESFEQYVEHLNRLEAML
jgi:hypothetical protein